MPRGDQTGPMGAGPMTGRAAGYCAGYAVPGFANPVGGRGFGAGFGFGRGRGRGFGFGRAFGFGGPVYGASAGPIAEADVLKAQADQLQSALENIRKRLAALEQAADK